MRTAIVLCLAACSYPHPAHQADASSGNGGDDAVADAMVDAGPGNITLTTLVAGQPTSLVFVAAQDGDGPWTVLTSTNGTYHFSSTTGRYGYAYLCQGTQETLNLSYQTTADSLAPVVGCGGSAPSTGGPTGELDVTAINFPPNDQPEITCASVGGQVTALQPTLMYVNAPTGTHDCVGLDETAFNAPPRSAVVTHGVSVPGSATIDFSQAVAVSWPTFSFSNLAASDPANPTTFELYLALHMGENQISTYAPNATSGTYLGMPTSLLGASDVYTLIVSQYSASGVMDVAMNFHAAKPLAISLPDPVIGATATTAAAAPYFRPHVSVPIDITPASYGLMYNDQVGDTIRAVGVTATTAWIGPASTFDYTFPDLSALPGWSNDWIPAAQQAVGVSRDVSTGVSGKDGYSESFAYGTAAITPS